MKKDTSHINKGEETPRKSVRKTGQQFGKSVNRDPYLKSLNYKSPKEIRELNVKQRKPQESRDKPLCCD